MSARENGGPAFPCGESYSTTDLAGNTTTHRKGPLKYGMTLRDYFAAKAMQAMLAGHISHYGHENYWAPQALASEAYERADAMLKEREK